MVKAEIIREVANATGQKINTCDGIINAFLFSIQKELTDGGVVELKNFGVFKVVDKAEREGINPQTQEKITIPAHKSPQFSASKFLKEIVNGKRAFLETKKAPAVAEAD